MVPALVIIVVVLVCVFGYYGWLAAKKRREALAALAHELGWRFWAGTDHGHDEEYSHFEIFRRGSSRVAYNTLVGTIEIDGRECPAKMGDFRYTVTTSTGKSSSSTTYRFSYLIVHLPYGRVPDLLIRPEGLMDKLVGAIGFDDIDFESAEFSRRFYVKSAEKRFAYDVIHPRMMEFLLATQPPCVDIEYRRCCVSDGRRKWTPEEFRAMIEWLGRFFATWPEHVTESLREHA